MSDIALQISKKELSEVVKAYSTLQNFLSKIIPLDELYTGDFLNGLNEALNDKENENYIEIKNLEDFTG